MFWFDDDENEEMAVPQDVKIMATFGQYEGNPITLLALGSHIDGKPTLMILADDNPTYTTKDGHAVLTDSTRFNGADFVFAQTDFLPALEAYKQLKSTHALLYDDAVRKYDVGDSIEIDGVKDSGRFNYRMQGITNGHMAVLAACLFFTRQDTINSCINMAEALAYTYRTI